LSYWKSKENPLLNVSNEQFVEILEFIKNCRREGKIEASYGCEGYLGNYETEVRDGFSFAEQV